MGVPVGWDSYGNPWFQKTLPVEYSVPFTPPPPPPGGVPAVNIAPPKTTLD